jgi:Winged helix-turn-helix DNA-binding
VAPWQRRADWATLSASSNERGCIYAGVSAMADLVDRIRKELDARIDQLRPLASEFERLQRAAAALARTGSRALPGLGSHAPPPPRASARTARRVTSPAAGKSSPERRPVTARRTRAPRGQTQAKILAALRATPGATTATVAKSTAIPASTVAATVSRLVKQGRVRRLDEGGYAVLETPADAAAMNAGPATADAAPAASDTQAPASETPQAQQPTGPGTPTTGAAGPAPTGPPDTGT